MKVETSITLAGDVSLEVIGESDFEIAILRRAWELNSYKSGNGRTKDDKGSYGFYVPLFTAAQTERAVASAPNG